MEIQSSILIENKIKPIKKLMIPKQFLERQVEKRSRHKHLVLRYK